MTLSRSNQGEQIEDVDWNRKRRQILDAAAEVFFQRGFARGTTREIASKVGMSQPSIYHYVGAKDDLMSEIARQVARDFTERFDEATEGGGEPLDRLLRVIDSFVASLGLNQRTFAVYWKEYRSLTPEVAASVGAEQRDYVRRFEALIDEVQKSGHLPADQPTRLVSQGILGMMSWMHWWYRDDEFSLEQVAATFKAMLGLSATA